MNLPWHPSESYELCSNQYYDSAANRASFLDTLQGLNTSYTTTTIDIRRLSSCVSHGSGEDMDSYYYSHCCHYPTYTQHYPGACALIESNSSCVVDSNTGNVLLPPSHYIGAVPSTQSGWGDHLQSLYSILDQSDEDDTRSNSNSNGNSDGNSDGNSGGRVDLYNSTLLLFQCITLPACQVTCAGPDRDIMASVTQGCGCTVEWYVHSNVFRCLLACVTFIIVNVSRMVCSPSL